MAASTVGNNDLCPLVLPKAQAKESCRLVTEQRCVLGRYRKEDAQCDRKDQDEYIDCLAPESHVMPGFFF